MLYYIFTVDGDWKSYFDPALREKDRLPQSDLMQRLIKQEIKFAKQNLYGKFIHFVHSSPIARDFFLQAPFVKLWQKIIDSQGAVGLHCHEDDLKKGYHFSNIGHMSKIIGQLAELFRRKNLSLSCYRGGYMAFLAELIPILKENNLCYDFSCEPQRYLLKGNQVVSDWRGSPNSFYEMDASDHRRRGNSGVYQIPVGHFNGVYLYFEKSNQELLREVSSNLKKVSLDQSCDIIVSVLTHSWEFETDQTMVDLERKTAVLREYGEFINLKDLSAIKGKLR